MKTYIVLDKLGNDKKAGDVLNVPADINQEKADLLLKKGRIIEQESKPNEETDTDRLLEADRITTG